MDISLCRLYNPLDILSLSRVPRANSSYKSAETKDLHVQMAVTTWEQFKGKMEISPYRLYNLLDIPSLLRVSRTNSSYRSAETKDVHAEMAVIMWEQLKWKMDISPCPLYNSLDGEQTLQAELLRVPVPNWLWMLQEVPTQIWTWYFPICVDEEEDADHILTCCPRFRWKEFRTKPAYERGIEFWDSMETI